jgi:hypothetical protein
LIRLFIKSGRWENRSITGRQNANRKKGHNLHTYVHTHTSLRLPYHLLNIYLLFPLSLSLGFLVDDHCPKRLDYFAGPASYKQTGYGVYTHTHTLDTTRIGQPKKIVVLFSQASDFPMASYKIKKSELFSSGSSSSYISLLLSK